MWWLINSILFCYLMLASITDFKKQIVSIKFAFLIGLTALVLGWIHPDIKMSDQVIGMLPGIGLLMVAYITHQAIGMGDGCVLLVLGCYTGIQGAVGVLLIALCLTAFFALYLLVVKQAEYKKTIPFVPFLLMGYCVWMVIKKEGGIFGY